MDDGLSNQIKKLDNSTEWIKEAIIQKAMNEFTVVDTKDYLEKYLINKSVDSWTIHAIEIISGDSLILYDGLSEFKETILIRFENIEPNLIDTFITDTKFLNRQFDDKNIEDYFKKWLKTCLISSNHYNLLSQKIRDNLNSISYENIDDVCFLHSITQSTSMYEGSIRIEEEIFIENFERMKGRNFEDIKKFFIKLGIVSIGYSSSNRYKYRYWRLSEISCNIMREFYKKHEYGIHSKIYENLTKDDIKVLSKIVDFQHNFYNFGIRGFYPRSLIQCQDEIIDNFDKEIRDFVSRSILILLPSKGGKKRPGTREYYINPMAIHAVNQRIAEFFIH